MLSFVGNLGLVTAIYRNFTVTCDKCVSNNVYFDGDGRGNAKLICKECGNESGIEYVQEE